MIPISVVTGFLGSGKTTLISRVLRDPAFTRTAVIVNEFGDVGLDHDLIASSNDDSVVALSSGCLCCAIQTDLAKTLMALLERRKAGTAAFDRVLIETSGLSDPVPILQTILGDADVAGTHRLAAVVTVVDPIHGERTLEEHPEARHQIAVADTLLISKTDLRAPSDQLLARLEVLNADAQRTSTAHVDPMVLFHNSSSLVTTQRLAALSRRHGHNDIRTFAVTQDKPLRALSLTMLLQAIAEHCGERLLRFKGLIAIEEMPGQPAAVHGVRHVVGTPEFLDRWPSGDETTRMVFIGRDVPQYFIPRLLDILETEVRDTTTDADLAREQGLQSHRVAPM